MTNQQILSLLAESAAPDEWHRIHELLEEFDHTEDWARLKEICTLLAPDEEKFVRLLNRDFIDRHHECDVLVSNVGFSPQPIILMTLALRPQKLFLLHTGGKKPNRPPGSLKDAEFIRDNAAIHHLMGEQVYLFEVSEDDTEYNYALYKREIYPHCTDNTCIDPTGGRKIMSIALATFAFQYRIKMVYVLGHQKKGLIKPFTEKFEIVKDLFEYYGDPSLQLIQDLFNRRNYSAALEAVKKLSETVRNGAIAKKLDVLDRLIQTYLEWDRFAHSQIDPELPRLKAGSLEAVRHEMSRFGYRFVNTDELDRNIRFLQKLEDTWAESNNLVDPGRLVDLFLNARRRAEEQKYDDAVARLYRLAEMCFSYVLIHEYQIGKTAKPDYSTILANQKCDLPQLQARFLEKMKRDLPAGNLSADIQARLLTFLNHPVGHKYNDLTEEKDGKLSVMARRNRSILAHGSVPVDRATYEEFRHKINEMLRFMTRRYRLPWDDLINDAEHPQVKLL